MTAKIWTTRGVVCGSTLVTWLHASSTYSDIARRRVLMQTRNFSFYAAPGDIVTGRPARSAAMPVLFLLSSRKTGFSPQGATRCPDKREIWHGERTPCQISRLSGQKCGNTAPKTVKILNFGHKFALTSGVIRLHNFYEILRFYTHL